jgi:selenocysteine lyase/cysteine desulfurase
MSDPWNTWRHDTPGTGKVIHFNNAGAGLMAGPVLDTITAHLRLESEIGGYEAAAAKAPQIEAVYRSLARLLGARPHNVAIVENATVGFSQALSAFDLQPGDRIVTTQNDYASHQLSYLALKARRGVEVAWASDAAEGGVDPDAFRRELAHPRTRLATLCWSPNNSGLLQDVASLSALCRQAGVPSLVDACQAVGQLPIDFERIGCDFLTGSARKFLRGPRGIGFLIVSDRMLRAGRHPLHIDGRGATWQQAEQFVLADSAQRFENWEFPYALVLGMGRAAEYARQVGVDVASRRAFALAVRLRERLRAAPELRILDRGPALGAIVSVAIAGHDAQQVVTQLRAQGINGSASQRSWSLRDMDSKGVESTLRLSPHYYNTEDEVDAVAAALAALLR